METTKKDPMNHMKNEIDKINRMYDDMMARGGGKAPCDTLCWGAMRNIRRETSAPMACARPAPLRSTNFLRTLDKCKTIC